MVIQNELLLAEQCPFEFSRYIVEQKNYEIPFSIYLARLKGIYGYAPKKEKEEEEPAVKRTMSMH